MQSIHELSNKFKSINSKVYKNGLLKETRYYHLTASLESD